MATALRSTLERLVHDFANEVLGALRTASLSDLAAETGHGVGSVKHAAAPAGSAAPRARRGKIRLHRRSPEAIGAVVEKVVSLLKSKPGLRAEQIRAELGLAQNELPRPIAEALSGGRISKVGLKRATRYFAGKRPAGGAGAAGGRGKRGPGKKRGRRGAKK
jgi:hypothetical protein